MLVATFPGIRKNVKLASRVKGPRGAILRRSVRASYTEGFLARLGPDGVLRCTCGREHRVATAASVDAYTSATAALRTGGYHQAIPARPSEVVVCDTDVLARAPSDLFLAGLGDLLAKFLAHLDWTIAHLVAGDPFCEVVAE